MDSLHAEGERRTVEADLGPARYLATLLGAGDQDVLWWFILAVALLSILPPCCCHAHKLPTSSARTATLSRLRWSGQRIEAVIASLQ